HIEGRHALVLQDFVGLLLEARIGPPPDFLELAQLGAQTGCIVCVELAQRRAGSINRLGEILPGAGGGSSRRRNVGKLGPSHQGKGEEPPHWTDSISESAIGCASYGKMWPPVKFSA